MWKEEQESQHDLAFHIEEQHTSPRTSYYLGVSLQEDDCLITLIELKDIILNPTDCATS